MSKIGHNSPCSCGSGLKYKKCCLLSQIISEDAQRAKDESDWQKWFEKDLAMGRENLATIAKYLKV